MFGPIHSKEALAGSEAGSGDPGGFELGWLGTHPKSEQKSMSLFGPSRVPKREVLGAILGEKIGPKRQLDEAGCETCDFS